MDELKTILDNYITQNKIKISNFENKVILTYSIAKSDTIRYYIKNDNDIYNFIDNYIYGINLSKIIENIIKNITDKTIIYLSIGAGSHANDIGNQNLNDIIFQEFPFFLEKTYNLKKIYININPSRDDIILEKYTNDNYINFFDENGNLLYQYSSMYNKKIFNILLPIPLDDNKSNQINKFYKIFELLCTKIKETKSCIILADFLVYFKHYLTISTFFESNYRNMLSNIMGTILSIEQYKYLYWPGILEIKTNTGYYDLIHSNYLIDISSIDIIIFKELSNFESYPKYDMAPKIIFTDNYELENENENNYDINIINTNNFLIINEKLN